MREYDGVFKYNAKRPDKITCKRPGVKEYSVSTALAQKSPISLLQIFL